mgnify:CR=1 FL=1
MDISTADQLKKVQKVSTFVTGAFKTLMVLVGIASVLKLGVLVFMPDAAVTMTDSGVEAVPADNPSFNFHLRLLDIEITADELVFPVRIFTGIALILSVVVYMKILQHLVLLFSGYAEGLIFTRANVHQIRQIGITILCIPLFWMVVDIGFIILMKIIAPGTAIVESGYPLVSILAGTIVVLMSWIMDVGRALHEESELVI